MTGLVNQVFEKQPLNVETSGHINSEEEVSLNNLNSSKNESDLSDSDSDLSFTGNKSVSVDYDSIGVSCSPGKKFMDKDLVKRMYHIVRLRQMRSKNLPKSLRDLKADYGSYRSIAKQLQISWGEFQCLYMIRKRVQKVYKRKVSQEMKEAIAKFCMEGPVAINLPEAQYAGKAFLNVSLKHACEMFNNAELINRRICVSTFRKYLPRKTVKLQSKIPLRSALCEECVNFKLLAQGLTGAGLVGVIGGGKEAVQETLCPFKHLLNDTDECKKKIGQFGHHNCLFSTCSKCGVKQLKLKIEESNQSITEDRIVHWFAWESV